MAYEFKNLADVELLSAMPETANVLVEVDGATKRAPQVKPVDEIEKIVTSESLTEVPTGATVLAEVNGEIKRVPGEELGGKGMIVNFTKDSNSRTSSDTIIADKTYEEIKLALREGRHVIGIYTDSDSSTTISYTFNVSDMYMNSGTGTQGDILFYSWINTNSVIALRIFPDNTIEQTDLLDFPSTTTSITSGSSSVVTSGAVYTALQAKQDVITDHIILSSSTTDSTKKFKITVDDSGTLTATEVAEVES